MDTIQIVREKIKVKGIVQGVGFRPFVYNLALKFSLSGFVTNTRNGVEIEIEGAKELVDQFVDELINNSPELSEIESLNRIEVAPLYEDVFEIIKSENLLGNQTLISPDVSICEECKNELFDENNRRYLYPFINCTNCGPRFTIIENIPYDRPLTTMKDFEMCPDCKSEYENPADRRFHAQPNACPDCGPQIKMKIENQIFTSYECYPRIADLLNNGKIGAIKGLGGFHLAVDAENNAAILELRKRKNREAKPLAIMVKDIKTAEMIAEISENEKKILSSAAKPIVLVIKKNNIIAEAVAPNNKRIGIMLPYTPLHYIIFDLLKKHKRNGIAALVMTSANLSEEPICISNSDAAERLQNITDFIVDHNREILIRADDSVVAFFNNKQRIIRRSRGFVPKSIKLINNVSPILAVGAELKNTICISKNNNAFLSQHIGDLSNLRSYEFFLESIEHMQKIMDVKPEIGVCDLHPDYFSSRWMKEKSNIEFIEVQHHHAHMASCMIENGINENAIGLILDGTGLGYDNTSWGGEILYGNYTTLERLFYLKPIKLPGGDAASKEPWRIAVSYLYSAFDGDIPSLKYFEDLPVKQIREMIELNINSPLTSSAGRLFDAVSALAGGPRKIRYEAEAAITLMNASENKTNDFFEYDLPVNKEIDINKIIRNVFKDSVLGKSIHEIGTKFHFTLSKLLTETVILAANEKHCRNIVLSGGVFQNEILSEQIENILTKHGLNVYIHTKTPANDGGISLGQLAVAAELLKLNKSKVEYIN